MLKNPHTISILFLTLLCSCSPKHLINDRAFRESVQSDFRERESLFGNRTPEIFRKAVTEKDPARQEAVMFLAAYMPLSDFADNSSSLICGDAYAALQTRKDAGWGKDIPEDIFLHFVLPPRVNNENLDSFRLVYHSELASLVKGKSLADAALAVNHWCREKVTYQPSDSRTSSPLSTILSARGRCGEESTFTVSALRAAGIPARQVYTPRWAHTDDNHAWVEVWVDGKWHYMGACEPEPVLDRGWFTEPARRAMLIHTKAFGRYNGNEPVVKSVKYFTELNCLPEYAVTKDLIVTVSNSRGERINNATVDFLLYNYAELYPIASLATDAKGRCHLLTGLGDLVVWAHNGDRFGFSHVNVSECDTLRLTIADTTLTGYLQLDLKAPVARTPLPGPDPELVRMNNLRVAHDDSIRNAYVNSWKTDEAVKRVLNSVRLDEKEVKEILAAGMGNYKALSGFIAGSGEKAGLAMRLLENVSEKDLRDGDAAIFADHLLKAPQQDKGLSDDIYDRYLLSPRVANEKLSSWRTLLPELIPSAMMDKFSHNPGEIADWIDTAITVTNTENYYNVPLTPGAVASLRMSDVLSEKIFYVALCRTLGIPARIDPATDRTQYYLDNKWNDAFLNGEKGKSQEKAFITFSTSDISPVPEYYTNFTLARLENGRYRTLELDVTGKINTMPHDIPVGQGKYMLFTGNRINDVTILTGATFFELRPGEHKVATVSLRHSEEQPAKAGEIDYKRTLVTLDGREMSFADVADKGVVAIWIAPGTEPANHIFADIPAFTDEFNKWGGSFIFFINTREPSSSFNPSEIKGLPQRTFFAKDDDCAILKSVFERFKTQAPQMPVIIYADKSGDIYYFSEGYRVGAGDQILKSIK